MVAAGVSALILALIVIAAVFALGVRTIFPDPSRSLRWPAEQSGLNGIVAWAHGGDTGGKQPNAEFNAARLNGEAVDRWITRCTSDLLQKPVINARVRAQFGKYGESYAADPSNLLTQDAVLPAATDLRFLSKSLLIGRGENALAAANAYLVLQIATLVAIALGLATTVLVSLSSTEFGKGDGRTARAIRILAIVFPALGTATAAVAAFYAPGQSYARASQALAGFRQVHDQIASDLGELTCPTSSDPGAANDLSAKLAGWKKSLRDVQSLAQAAALAAADATRGQVQPGGGVGNTGDGQKR
ncbi:hypothetical protein Rmet_5486 (plasmid) [Cupriavidus metallidurans CH34]|uniref:Transmembrane protein n=1 Tax=Cupriavidus metallidurans (strain ATCC 43123 / DSM 2839 / NBRC 102507 / CH34) TaxID=266264 RepID=Q1LBY1_CUPMC|nr:hypothetical protein Rmet_5486 [Cupriavidus metallidurans CH34]